MIIPYLTFCGNCEEALNFYIGIFGGEITALSRYTRETGGDELAGQVMHAEAVIGGTAIAGADGADPKELAQYRDAICLMIHFSSRAEAEKCFDKLAEDGGHPLQRLTPHPPPDDGGMGALVRDRFGYKWILTAPNDLK